MDYLVDRKSVNAGLKATNRPQCYLIKNLGTVHGFVLDHAVIVKFVESSVSLLRIIAGLVLSIRL